MLAILCCVVISSIVSNAESDEYLIVGVPTDRCPMFYFDEDAGIITGIGADLMTAAAKEAGYIAVFRVLEEKNLKDALDNPGYDVIMPFGSAITSSSGNPSVVSDNLIQTPFTLVTVNQSISLKSVVIPQAAFIALGTPFSSYVPIISTGCGYISGFAPKFVLLISLSSSLI
ncbi:hypothetical protein [Butyrivibrio sp. VCD2006]|uniref:hypothetical protein n=1 Tax=Butyrivibrio sp. VCD2006 TaxID=1280664 RepID=UPI0003FACA49|nr:hypothetical protein [Butyrivibrio sp. VCD2006]